MCVHTTTFQSVSVLCSQTYLGIIILLVTNNYPIVNSSSLVSKFPSCHSRCSNMTTNNKRVENPPLSGAWLDVNPRTNIKRHALKEIQLHAQTLFTIIEFGQHKEADLYDYSRRRDSLIMNKMFIWAPILRQHNYVLNMHCRSSCPNHMSKILREGFVKLNMFILDPLTLSAYGGKLSKRFARNI